MDAHSGLTLPRLHGFVVDPCENCRVDNKSMIMSTD